MKVLGRRTEVAVCGLAIAGAAAAVGCGGEGRQGTSGGRLRAVATTTIVGDLVRTIAGEDADVDVLMGPGVDPHLYKASAGDVSRLGSAQIIFYNGLHLEGKMTEVLAGINDRGVRTVAVGECIPQELLIPLSGSAGLRDPHIWFDVALWAQTVDCVADELSTIDPTHADGYRQRAAALASQLTVLDDEVRRRAAELPSERRVLVTAHDAFSYFGRAYGFEVRGLLGVSTASEAGTADVTNLAAFIAERGIPAVFVETSVPPRFVQALREAVLSRGFEVAIGGSLYSDSLGDPGTPAGTYEGTVRANVETIVTALAGSEASEDE